MVAETDAREDDKEIVLRHYTSISSLESIESELIIRASDRNRVFAVRAKGNPLSSRDAERSLGLTLPAVNGGDSWFI